MANFKAYQRKLIVYSLICMIIFIAGFIFGRIDFVGKKNKLINQQQLEIEALKYRIDAMEKIINLQK